MEVRNMHDLPSLIWIELRKALRSRMPLWTALGSLFMPLGIAFLLFVARNPEISRQLGLVGAKANLVAYAATDWTAYLRVYAEVIGAGGLILFTLIISWIFGREFTDGTLKDVLAVPIQRSSIVIAKYIVMVIWSEAMTVVIFIAGLIMGGLLRLPGSSTSIFIQGCARVMVTSFLAIAVVFPFALFASMGRGILLPIGVAILIMVMTNLAQILGWGEFFPWAVPVLYSAGGDPLAPFSYWIVFLTGLAGGIGTVLWWNFIDQNR
jgi:ABC-2 type transport system permease protein